MFIERECSLKQKVSQHLGIPLYIFKEEKVKMKTTRKHAKSLLVVLLAILVLIGTAQPAFANSVTDEIEKHLVSPQGNEDGTGWEAWNAEYESYGERWANYFLDLLPDSSNPEALQLLTKLPEYDNIANENTSNTSWSQFFMSHGKGVTVVRDEAFRLSRELGLDNPNWSTEQKMARLNEWLGDHYSATWDGPPYYWGNYKGPLNWNETVDGYQYDCVSQANGIMTLYRIAGIPATAVSMDRNGIPHREAFYYDGTTWRHPGIRYNGVETFTDYFKIIRGHYVHNVHTRSSEYYMLTYGNILDINEGWIDDRAEHFIFELIQTPYAHPEKALTRGEVAKIVCNFLNVVPMRNEQIFSDVPVIHKYSSYIWAMNSLGIMNGVVRQNV
jgi:hypothetical protein